ncbi:MAG: hypothetical protein JXR64_07035 [Spirochaetales bacterium]|nr:hypothetical protein [Spirochaetales bacterium]
MITPELLENTSKKIAVLVLMRAALFFVYGIADELESHGKDVSLILM